MVHGIEAIQINFIRFFIGGIVMLPFALKEIKEKNTTFDFKDILYFFALGTLLVPLANTFNQIAIEKNSASFVAFVFSSNPIFITILSYIILKERINIYLAVAVILGIIGLTIMFDPFKFNYNKYSFYALIAAILFSFYIILMQKANKKYGNLIATGLTINFGTIVFYIYLLFKGISIFDGINNGNILLILYIGVFCSGIAYLSYFTGILLTSTNTGSIVFFLKPIISTILAMIVLNEKVSSTFLVGALIIVISSILLVYSRKKLPKNN
jgi:drug/metabolite transporter (DMT)-like permease